MYQSTCMFNIVLLFFPIIHFCTCALFPINDSIKYVFFYYQIFMFFCFKWNVMHFGATWFIHGIIGDIFEMLWRKWMGTSVRSLLHIRVACYLSKLGFKLTCIVRYRVYFSVYMAFVYHQISGTSQLFSLTLKCFPILLAITQPAFSPLYCSAAWISTCLWCLNACCHLIVCCYDNTDC